MEVNEKIQLESYEWDKFYAGLRSLGIECSQEKINQFLKFYQMLIEKNKVMNLTAITEFEDVVEKHFLDSLSLVKCINLNQNLRVLDLGTGAGFPGIPLKIVFPQLEIVLMDSLNKRVLFLKEVIEELNLSDILAVHGRAEEMAGKKEYREQFDLCISRAVANLSSLSEYCIPFVKIGGNFISYKSGEIEEETAQAKKAISVLGGSITKVEKFILTGTEVSRSFIQIEKKKKTPKSYPRKAGTPSKNPIH
ncbi:16S rRNA (guanine(527)-N(7))-methyltransferase GidB [Lachnospiraceae bacterium 3-1]|nr:16S rRNA (guanine(527)-N(7))-methyltransferase GidB [Lachnospiraceae bacterium 3-1]